MLFSFVHRMVVIALFFSSFLSFRHEFCQFKLKHSFGWIWKTVNDRRKWRLFVVLWTLNSVWNDFFRCCCCCSWIQCEVVLMHVWIYGMLINCSQSAMWCGKATVYIEPVIKYLCEGLRFIFLYIFYSVLCFSPKRIYFIYIQKCN